MKYFKILLFLLFAKVSFGQQFCPSDTIFPFTTDSVHLKIWNKSEYIPFFVKGCNLGVSVPGKQPGELDVSRAQYGRWFALIKEAGFNSIRIYTLHFPQFYEVLDSFNIANAKNPLFFFQGVWMEEELPNYNKDLFTLDSSFTREIEDNVNSVHGNKIILPRLGKAYGTYTIDASKWNIGYIIGRETQPIECLITNQAHPNDTTFNGTHFSIIGNPSEVFVTKHINHLVEYEYSNYQTQRPISFSSWPTLDPLDHPAEPNNDEDTASIDLNNINFNNAPAGYFASYHAYPYYPDFIGADSINQNYSDAFGPNSYLGYLNQLKKHYTRIPLIIAETSVPSSWGAAHYTSNGMNHGGFDQQKQGETIIRIMHNVQDAGCGGGIDFAFMDEWFKRTWVTNNIDYDADRRCLWHNIMAAEQNFGLIGFQRPLVMQNWATFPTGQPITAIKAAADYDFFHIDMALGEQMQNPDDIWIAIDTYRPDLGESILPSGDTLTNRAEFALHITNYSAQLYVTEAYDIYGIYHQISSPNQLYHSIATDGAPWLIERWKNNSGNNQVQYVGDLKVNTSFLPASSMDAVTIYPDSIHIRLPWSLLLFTDPSRLTVFDDNRSTPAPEDTTSDGIQIAAFYHNQRAEPTSRFTWPTWNTALDVVEYKKTSYNVVQIGMTDFNNSAIAISDNYMGVDSFPYTVSASNGLLKNDFDLDGNNLQALLIGNAQHGFVSLNFDGSYTYTADAGYVGQDYFEYSIFDGSSLSKTAYVCLEVDNSIGIKELKADKYLQLAVFPNPAIDRLTIRAEDEITNVALYNAEGKLVLTQDAHDIEISIDVSALSNGIYYLKSTVENTTLLNRINVSK